MPIHIMDSLEERLSGGLSDHYDILSELYFDEAESQEVAFAAIDWLFDRSQYNNTLRERHLSVRALVDLGAPYVGTGARMTLFVLGPDGARTPRTVLVSNYAGRAYDYRKEVATSGIQRESRLPYHFEPEYMKYCAEVEAWLNDGVVPESSSYAEYAEMDRSAFDLEHPYPHYYCRQAVDLRTALADEDAVPLSSLATIVRPRTVWNGADSARLMGVSNFKYPLNVSDMRRGRPTDVLIKKGDFIVSASTARDGLRTYRVREDPIEEVYLDSWNVVLRDLKVSADYLELYLGSKTGRLIAEFNSAGHRRRIRPEQLEELPIVLPRLGDEEYRRLVEVRRLSSKDMSAIRDAGNSFEARIADYRDRFGDAAQGVEEILDAELAENLRVYRQEQMREFLESDLNELNVCFAHGAYKATLILAGSILEAVLIDWLSEMHGVNYFSVPFLVTNGSSGRERNATLSDYIEEIKEIERPRWMVEAQKAHTIRKKRNLVHAKLCMRSDEVNEETCLQVIDYLRDVLRTRGVS